jgi:hypothetical protein
MAQTRKIHFLKPKKTESSIPKTACGSPYKHNSSFSVETDLSIFLKNESSQNCGMCMFTLNSKNNTNK